MTSRSRPPVWRRIVARWMAFENTSFQRFLRAERRIRSLPTNVHLQPSEFDRRIFRLFCGTVAALLAVLAIPSRPWRIRTLLALIVVLFVVGATFALLDAFPRRPGKR